LGIEEGGINMDRKELFARVDHWTMARDFWKSSSNDWEDIFIVLMEKGFTFDDSIDIIESVIGLTKQEYGE
jgi:hypothetical protein